MGKKSKKVTKKDSVLSPNKFDTLKADDAEDAVEITRFCDSDEDESCRVCKEGVSKEIDGLQCDMCNAWVHSDEECSDLTKTQFKFIKKCTNPAIQYICMICRDTDTEAQNAQPIVRDAIAKNTAKIDSVGESVEQLKKQNEEILALIKDKCKADDGIKQHVTEVVKNQKEKDERKYNLILYNIPESDPKVTLAQAELEDVQNVKNIFKFVCPSVDNSGLLSKSVTRCGSKRVPNAEFPNPKPRPIKVVLQSPSEAALIRKNARKLKDNDGLNHVGISEDKPYNERVEDRKLRSELLRRRNENKEDVVIFNKQVILRSEINKHKTNANSGEAPPTSGQQGASSRGPKN